MFDGIAGVNDRRFDASPSASWSSATGKDLCDEKEGEEEKEATENTFAVGTTTMWAFSKKIHFSSNQTPALVNCIAN